MNLSVFYGTRSVLQIPFRILNLIRCTQIATAGPATWPWHELPAPAVQA